MKLAEALSLRADLQKRLAQLRYRLVNNAKVQEGEVPSEAPADLLKELDESVVLLEKLIASVSIMPKLAKSFFASALVSGTIRTLILAVLVIMLTSLILYLYPPYILLC